MSCHRPTARHCSCAPEPVRGPELLLVSSDPRAAAALRALAAPLDAEVTSSAPGVLRVQGDVAALLVAAASALPVGALPPATDHPEPLAALPLREELAAQLERELARQRPGTTTGLLFCDLVATSGPTGADRAAASGGASPGAAVIGAAAGRLRRVLRRSDPLAHCGGGRFLALLCDLPADAADEVAARAGAAVRSCLDEPVATGAGLFPLSPAVGVLVCPAGAGAADLLAAADRALDAGTGTGSGSVR